MIGEIGLGAVIVAWVGSLELRIKNRVSRDRFNDLKDDLKDDVCYVKGQILRVDKKIDMLLIHNSLVPPEEDD